MPSHKNKAAIGIQGRVGQPQVDDHEPDVNHRTSAFPLNPMDASASPQDVAGSHVESNKAKTTLVRGKEGDVTGNQSAVNPGNGRLKKTKKHRRQNRSPSKSAGKLKSGQASTKADKKPIKQSGIHEQHGTSTSASPSGASAEITATGSTNPQNSDEGSWGFVSVATAPNINRYYDGSKWVEDSSDAEGVDDTEAQGKTSIQEEDDVEDADENENQQEYVNELGGEAEDGDESMERDEAHDRRSREYAEPGPSVSGGVRPQLISEDSLGADEGPLSALSRLHEEVKKKHKALLDRTRETYIDKYVERQALLARLQTSNASGRMYREVRSMDHASLLRAIKNEENESRRLQHYLEDAG